MLGLQFVHVQLHRIHPGEGLHNTVVQPTPYQCVKYLRTLYASHLSPATHRQLHTLVIGLIPPSDVSIMCMNASHAELSFPFSLQSHPGWGTGCEICTTAGNQTHNLSDQGPVSRTLCYQDWNTDMVVDESIIVLVFV